MESQQKRDELLQKGAELSGLQAQGIGRLCFLARWNVERLEQELETPDGCWLDRLSLAAKTRELELFRESAERILGTGPASLAGLDRERWLKLVPPAFRSLALDWTPASGNILAVGPTGAGKTVSAAFAAVRLASCLARAKTSWCRAVDLGMARLRHPLGDGEAPMVERAMRAEALFLDDLGWEPEKDATVREVLAVRYDSGLATVVTSGLTTGELSARYGAAVMRRIAEVEGVRGRLIDVFPKAAS